MIDSAPQPTALLLEEGCIRDLDGVMAVMRSAFGTRYGEAWTRSQCAGILPMSGVTLTVARTRPGGAAVGFSLVRAALDEAELLLIAVDPAHRRRGIAQALLNRFELTAKAGGVHRLHLEVRDGNEAVAMYRAAGFEPVGRRPRYYLASDGFRHDAITLAKTI